LAKRDRPVKRIVPVSPPDPSAFANAEVEAEYERFRRQLDSTEELEIAGCLTAKDILRAHFLIGDFFYSEGHGMGGLGPRDLGLLYSAVSRQHVGFGGVRKWADSIEMCATLLYGLVMDHPFHDANKRTAMLSCLYQLSQHKRTPTVTHKALEDFIVEIAERRLSNFARYQQMERKDVDDPEVRMIAHHLRRNTRQIDTRNYTITFWDLKRILNRFDFDLQNPNNNFIDVVRIDRRKLLFGIHKIERKLIVRIGFPSWTTQVFANTIKTVRNATGLVPANQVDSQMFYNGTDDVRQLIAHYQEPLRHLADR